MSSPPRDNPASLSRGISAPSAEERLRFGLLVAVGLVFFVWMLVGIFARPSVFTTSANTHNTSPAGHHALRSLLDESDAFTVSESTTAIYAEPSRGEWSSPFEPRRTLVMLEPDPKHVHELRDEVARFFASDQAMPDLFLVLPKRDMIPVGRDEKDQTVLLQEFLVPLGEAQQVLDDFGLGADINVHRSQDTTATETATKLVMPTIGLELAPWAGDTTAVVQTFALSPLSFAKDDVTVLMETAAGEPVALLLRDPADSLGRAAEGGVAIVVSDPDIFGNARLGREGVGDAVMTLFHLAENGTFVIDERLHGLVRTASIEYVATTPPGLWLTLALMLALGIFGWQQSMVRVSPQPPKAQEGSRADSIDTLARLMQRARDHGAAREALRRRSQPMLRHGAPVPGAESMQASHADGEKKPRVRKALASGSRAWESARAEALLLAEARAVAQTLRKEALHGTSAVGTKSSTTLPL